MKAPSAVEYRLLALVVFESIGRDVARAYWRAAGKDISFGTLYTTLARMKHKGWVTSRKDPGDGRARYFRITAAGTKVLATTRRRLKSLSEFAA